MRRPVGVRTIAFYLPQFYPIPENDEWWGKGFTEWTNVAKARPLFRGHYQPHVPADLGFYDLRLSETRETQANLAREYGLGGFCHYHYWLHGRRLLNRPFDEVLSSGRPEFPFCLCWANHNWTRRWDGQDQELLVEQRYSEDDDVAHIRWLLDVFSDRRYITIDGRPLFLVIRINSLPDPRRTAETWRREAKAAGLPGLYLCTTISLPSLDRDAADYGFDAAVDFQPTWVLNDRLTPWWRRLRHLLFNNDPFLTNYVRSYPLLAQYVMGRPEPGYKVFPGITPAWDNTPRRRAGAHIFVGSTPKLFGHWLRWSVNRAAARFEGDEQLVFINAWNEWAEGNHLEPDQRWGRQYLEATARALAGRTRT